MGLIVDIGGGTSDFTLFRQKGEMGIDILASNGLRLGGTDFDRELSLTQVMPHLGRGSQIRHAFGDETHTAPNGIFADLATWHKIPFLYGPDSRRMASELAKYAVEPDKLNRLTQVLEDHLGHDLAFAVESGKISANDPNARALPDIDLSVIETDLRIPLPSALLTMTLAGMAKQIAQTGCETLASTDLSPADVTQLILVGGSSLMGVVEHALRGAFSMGKVHRGAAMTGVVEGLAVASEEAFEQG